MSEPRFYVREIWGFLSPHEGRHTQAPGVSAHVLDRLYNCTPVAIYRSENEGYRRGAAAAMRATAIRRANEHAARLNAEFAP